MCATSKQQEVIHIVPIHSQLFVSELHRDNTLPLQRHKDSKRSDRIKGKEREIDKKARKRNKFKEISNR